MTNDATKTDRRGLWPWNYSLGGSMKSIIIEAMEKADSRKAKIAYYCFLAFAAGYFLRSII